jgi:hypothetical protein
LPLLFILLLLLIANSNSNVKAYLLKLQYLKEAGWADGGRLIACSQPRRLAVQVIQLVLLFIYFFIL